MKNQNSFISKVFQNSPRIKKLSAKIKWSIFVVIILLILSLSIILAYLFNFLMGKVIEVANANFGKLETSKTLLIWGATAYISAFICGIFYFLTKKKKRNLWGAGTIFLIIWVLVSGFFTISATIGNKQEISLYLLDENNTKVGTIICKGQYYAALTAGDKINCEINNQIKLAYESRSILLFYRENEENKEDIKDLANYSFNAPMGVYYGLVVIEGIQNERWRKITTGYEMHFLSSEEFVKNRKRFLNYLLALFAITFISIPTAMVNLKKLFAYSKKTDELEAEAKKREMLLKLGRRGSV